MSHAKNIQVWSWRTAIEHFELKPMTKLVLYTLANYMNDHGKGCYPSISKLCEATGLCKRSVQNSIKESCDKGFLIKKKRNVKGSEWASNEYEASYPSGVQMVTKRKNMGCTSLPDGVQMVTTGGASDYQVGCTRVPTNSPVNSPVESNSSLVVNKNQTEPENNKSNEIDLFGEVTGKLQDIINSAIPLDMLIVRRWLKIYEADFIVEVIGNWRSRKPDYPVRSMKLFDQVLADAKALLDSPTPQVSKSVGSFVKGKTWAEKEIERLQQEGAQNG